MDIFGKKPLQPPKKNATRQQTDRLARDDDDHDFDDNDGDDGDGGD